MATGCPKDRAKQFLASLALHDGQEARAEFEGVGFFFGGARLLSAPGKHDMSASDGSQVILQRARSLAGFPQRNASAMFTPGEFTTLMLPTMTRLPMLELGGPGALRSSY